MIDIGSDGWGEPFRSYHLKVVREFYASYVVSIDFIIQAGKKALDQPPLAHILVRSTWVELSKKMIWIFLFGPGFERLVTIDEFDYSMRTIMIRQIMAGS